MVETLVHFLQTNILPFGVIGVFLASVIEEVIAPIPSALVMTMSGFLFVSGPISFSSILALIFKVALPAALGVTLGSYVIYFAARWGGKYIIEKWGKYLGLYWSDVEKLKSKLNGTKRDEWLIGIARIIPFVPSVAISAFCGILEMNLAKYFTITFIGIFLRGLVLGTIGWQAGNVYEKYAEKIDSLEDWFLISTILALVIFIVLKYKSRKKEQI